MIRIIKKLERNNWNSWIKEISIDLFTFTPIDNGSTTEELVHYSFKNELMIN